jgi:Cdc6-like AAA superfamily ATPase
VAANKVVFASNINIGQNGAENDDEFLFRCFVDHSALAELRDLRNPASFLLGSTGIGKTALLRMLKHQEEHSSEIELHDIAMNYIANSDVIQFLSGLDVDLNVFFQSMWKHIICIEYIKMIGFAETKDKLRYWFGKVKDAISGNKRREVLDKFLRENENNFWNTIDVNIIEITDRLASGVNAELGAEVEKFVAKAGYSRSLSAEKKVQLQQRAKRYVNSETITELSHVIEALADFTKARGDKFFLLIDKLDEPWVDEGIKFKLIHALFEAIKYMKRLTNFKVVVALRNDLYERMISNSTASKSQIEKYDDYIVRLKWTKDQLKELAEKRLNHLFKWKYSKENVFFDDIYISRFDGKTSTWSYLHERTLNRPRDVINFVNLTLQASEGKSSVSKTDFSNGEVEYSSQRLQSLKYEWSSTYPGISVLLDLLKGRPRYFDVRELCTSDLTDKIYEKMGMAEEIQSDTLWQMLDRNLEGSSVIDPLNYARVVFHRLHLIGAVGLKTSSLSTWQWIAFSGKPINPDAIELDTKVEIHKMLKYALHLNDKQHVSRS